MKKKTIIICAAAVLVIAVVIGVAVAVNANRKTAAENQKSSDIVSGLEEPTLITSVLKDRSFTASSEAQSEAPTVDPSAPTEKDIVYNASNIPAVTELQRLGGQADSINLVWRDTKGVSGYRVYWRKSGVKDAVYTLFSTVKKANLEIRNLSAGVKYDFRVVAFVSDEYGSYEGVAAEAAFATVPKEVSGFALADATKDTTTIRWSANENVDGYSMQRCFGGVWSDYQTFNAGTTEFTDKELSSGRAYFYRITAFREDSGGKLESEAKDLYTVAGLIAPSDNGSVSKLGRVSLEYTSVQYADGYSIYMSQDNKKWNLLDDTAETHFSVTGLQDGETYYFRVYPYRDISYLKVRGPYLAVDFVADNEIYDKQVGDTYIEVSLSDQHMWYVKNGDVVLDSPVVSGNRNSMDTPKGYFSILSKASPCTLRGDDYVSYVDYWMAFIGGSYGLHDASWRSSFGGDIYNGDGSHGCVNLPTETAKELYKTASVGTPVIVY